jgi:WD40 repeat protein
MIAEICTAVQFLPHTHEVLSGGMDCQLLHWSVPNTTVLEHIRISEILKTPQVINPPFIHHVDVHKEEKLCGLGCGDGAVRFCSLYPSARPKMRLLGEVAAHQSACSQIHFAKFSRCHVVSGGNDGFVKIFKFTVNQTPTISSTKRQRKTNPKMLAPFAIDVAAVLSIAHTLKVNVLHSSSSRTLLGNLFVGDQSNNVTAYFLE